MGRQYKSLVMPDYQDTIQITRDELLWGFNFLVSSGWGSAPDGTGDKMLVPFSDFPNHRRESAQKASNRGFISAAKEYQAGEELTFDYGLLNDAVLAHTHPLLAAYPRGRCGLLAHFISARIPDA